MSEYEARGVKDGLFDYWVVGGKEGVAPIDELSEAEAKIIAFALNAIAEGKSLSSPWPPTEDDAMYRYGGMYDGPTDGVRQ